MKKCSHFFIVSAILCLFGLRAFASIPIIPSNTDLRFTNADRSEVVTFTLEDNPGALAGKTGVIRAQIKFNKKIFSVSPANIQIPYTNGVVGNSQPVTFTLKKSSSIDRDVSFSVRVANKTARQLDLTNYSDTVSIDVGGIDISGTISIPEDDEENYQFRIRSPRHARATRTSSFQGPSVKLYEVNADGSLGELISTTTVDGNQHFDFDLPEGATLGAHYAAVLQGSGGPDLTVFVDGEDIKIDPVNTFIFSEIAEKVGQTIGNEEIDLDHFQANELQAIQEQFEEFNPNIEATVDETIGNLETSFTDVMTNMIGVANDEDGIAVVDGQVVTQSDSEFGEVAGGVAGDYYAAFFTARLSGTSDENVYYSSHHFINGIQLGWARLSRPTPAGVVNIKPRPVLSSEAALITGSGGEACYELEAATDRFNPTKMKDGNPNLFVTIDPQNIMTVIQPARENSFTNMGTTFVAKDKDEVMKFYPVGEGLFFGAMAGGNETRLASNNTLMTNDLSIGFASIVKQSDFSISQMDGNYGLVGAGADYNADGRIAMRGLDGIVTVEDGSATANFHDVEVVREYSGESCSNAVTISSNEQESDGEATLSISNRKILISTGEEGASVFEGYPRPDGGVIVFVNSADRGQSGQRVDEEGSRVKAEVDNANREFNIAVRLPSEAPNLNGKSYKLLSYDVSFANDGGISISNHKAGSLEFTGGNLSFVDQTLNTISRTSDSSEVASSIVPASNSSATPTIADNGFITFTVDGKVFRGYISSDSALIVLNAVTNNSLGMYIAVLQE